MDQPLLFRDDHLAAFLKPSGLAVHRGWARDATTSLDLAAKTLRCRVFPVHRLDRGTSGVIVFALRSEVAAAMQQLFRANAVHKTYLALVRDTAPESGVIDHPIPNDVGGPRVDAITEFNRRWVGDRASLVVCRPRSGRLHQVRRHMKHISHPVLGDTKYGDGKVNRYHRDKYGLSRLALHAASICFVHPVSGASLCLQAPVPDDLACPFARLGIPAEAWQPPASPPP